MSVQRLQSARELSKQALKYLALFVAGLLAIFFLMELLEEGGDLWLDLQLTHLSQSTTAPQPPADTALLEDLQSITSLPATDIAQLLAATHDPSLTTLQRQTLLGCAAEAGKEIDHYLLEDCTDIIASQNTAATTAESPAETLLAALQQNNDARANFRESWLQAAQLILLNLMLPLLTGLLGYFSGKHEADSERRNSDG